MALSGAYCSPTPRALTERRLGLGVGGIQLRTDLHLSPIACATAMGEWRGQATCMQAVPGFNAVQHLHRPPQALACSGHTWLCA